jgi:nucleoid-associated protein YgaU
MELAKLSIWPENEPREPPKVMFNPNSYSITKAVTWNGSPSGVLNAPLLAFGGGGSRVLSLELFFDVTDAGGEVDVRTETDRIVRMTRIMRDQDSQRPPVCEIKWGEEKHEDFPFQGVITSLDQHFKLFHRNGRPLRAVLNVEFTEFLSAEDDLRMTDPEQTTHTARPHDTLAGISAQAYGTPTQWRRIQNADGKQIENPRAIAAGTRLVVPKLG